MKTTKLDTAFVTLDLKRGRKQMAGQMASGVKIPVVILGHITSQHSRDDGVSIEFGVDVEEAVTTDDGLAFMTHRGIGTGVALAYRDARRAGWYNDPTTGRQIDRNFGERIALIHSELSEALEAHRKNQMDDELPHRSGVEVELADAVIRIFDLAGAEGLDLAGAIIEKIEFNRTRHDHTAAGRTEANGKVY
jgi:NTP pyrophosphatase (non-canonical NTP hydrolase)